MQTQAVGRHVAVALAAMTMQQRVPKASRSMPSCQACQPPLRMERLSRHRGCDAQRHAGGEISTPQTDTMMRGRPCQQHETSRTIPAPGCESEPQWLEPHWHGMESFCSQDSLTAGKRKEMTLSHTARENKGSRPTSARQAAMTEACLACVTRAGCSRGALWEASPALLCRCAAASAAARSLCRRAAKVAATLAACGAAHESLSQWEMMS